MGTTFQESGEVMAFRTIVVSAVNLRKGGTLTILRDCLQYLSQLVKSGNWRVVALVHKRELCDYEGIEYIEMPDVIKSWGRRLWCEYVTMHKVSKELSPVYLWLSLHDTTPRVSATRRAVYCHNPFPFYDWNVKELYLCPKIVLFSLFSYFIYRINIHKNDYLVIQQEWIRDMFVKMFKFYKGRMIVALPVQKDTGIIPKLPEKKKITFFYASSANSHKNFEVLCEATKLLEQIVGMQKFQVVITVSGQENRYSEWLYHRWGNVQSLKFAGFMSKELLYGYYESSDCFVFPSKVETWGLPISEFAFTNKPMLLADRPYAYETAAGAKLVAFFDPENPIELMSKMKDTLEGNMTFYKSVPEICHKGEVSHGWQELFDCLLS